jgi:cysteine desulfurase
MFWNKKNKSNKDRVFLDYASVTPVDSRVADIMSEIQNNTWANPSAIYSSGLEAKEVLQQSKQKIANLLGGQSKEIFFTASGTESDNLAILGVFEHYYNTKKLFPKSNLGQKGFVPHIVTTVIEHPAILEACKEIERRGGEVTYVGVGEDGIVSPKDIASSIKENTVLVSVMYANNEIGTIQPIHDISRRIKDWRQKSNSVLPYFHTDACQGTLLPLNVQKLGVDMMTLDGIKMYGPRGIGFLYVKFGVEISPVNFGGGQEGGLRSGTENLPAVAGFAKALEIAEEVREKESERLTEIRDYAIEKILKTFPSATLNGSRESRLPNNINICFPGLDAEFAVISLDVAGISASYASSCLTLKESSSSYTIGALGKKDCATSSLRFTLGRESTKGDIDTLVEKLQIIIK